ncbi:uncharacterized protein M421DRAFT_3400 [Didymella exigua CBS 183.55]|uniref:Uncharacterized protein n=1 Tax=Didymella exigua CBS 183.55 TaxID=1150837 RepID=A0A6A5RSC1_9PLEO|nr:uncharacterized protein M421DRAFT_3400 [Didymella exigua CBS 183.55]KAF1930323.1 hypothetical protein M421DRAFT_3400 [Didymella exigua CBS 183.55]
MPQHSSTPSTTKPPYPTHTAGEDEWADELSPLPQDLPPAAPTGRRITIVARSIPPSDIAILPSERGSHPFQRNGSMASVLSALSLSQRSNHRRSPSTTLLLDTHKLQRTTSMASGRSMGSANSRLGRVAEDFYGRKVLGWAKDKQRSIGQYLRQVQNRGNHKGR